MSYSSAVTVRQIVENIEMGNYVLPVLQRDFSWDEEDICSLFDSLMKGCHIPALVFWEAQSEVLKDYKFYSFNKDYNVLSDRLDIVNTDGKSMITGVLDGQQRLTSLLIGLRGSYTSRLKNRRIDNPNSYPKRELYLNLLKVNELDDMDEIKNKYIFKFLTESDAKVFKDDEYWFKVNTIFNYETSYQATDALMKENDLVSKCDIDLARSLLHQLHYSTCVKQTMVYYTERSQDLNLILDTFLKLNSGGEKLTPMDLLLSTTTREWGSLDSRERLTALIRRIASLKGGFKVDNDYLMRVLFFMVTGEYNFNASRYKRKAIKEIEDKWIELTTAIEVGFELVGSFGFNKSSVNSLNSITPVILYAYNRGIGRELITSDDYAEDRKLILRFYTEAMINGVYATSGAVNLLTRLRHVLKNTEGGFPYEVIKEAFKGGPFSIILRKEIIEALIDKESFRGKGYALLKLLNLKLNDDESECNLNTIISKKDMSMLYDGVDDKSYNLVSNSFISADIKNKDMSIDSWLLSEGLTDDAIDKYKIANAIPLKFDSYSDLVAKRKEIILSILLEDN